MLTRTQHCGLPSCDAGMLGYLKHGSANLVTGIDTINHACSSHLPSISHLQLRRQRCGTVRPSPEESRRARSCSGFALLPDGIHQNDAPFVARPQTSFQSVCQP